MAQQAATVLGRLSRRAAELANAGRHQEAVSVWERLHRLAPANPVVAAGLGAALLGARRFQDALDWLAASCQRHPQSADLLRLLSHALTRLGYHGEAVGALYAALQLDPGSAQTHADLGTALGKQGLAQAALPHAEFAFKVEPKAFGGTLTNVLLDLGRTGDALSVIERAIRAGANRALMLALQSAALHALDEREDALAAARQAVAEAPANSSARFTLGLALLLRGQLTPEAWAMYESRAGLLDMRTWPEPERCWTGGDIAGRTLLLHAEQGYGDTLQFVRYVPLVAARGGKVVLVVQAPLTRLLQGTPGAEQVIDRTTRIPGFDLYCPLLSLPGVFGTTLDTIPPPVAYTTAFEPKQRDGALRVGLVWAGNTEFVDDRKRSIDPALLAPLAEITGVMFHSLQFGARELPLPNMTDLMNGIKDFADTAERIAGLDLVIAVDTSVAHLAATMGKPVWLLSRFHGCWRWMLDREDTPWYPTIRIFRQLRPNDWAEVIGRVHDELSRLAAGQRGVTTLAA